MSQEQAQEPQQAAPGDDRITVREFAARMGYKPHYGHQLGKEGRLVFADDGKHVLWQASRTRFEASRDPARQAVADRHASTRAALAQEGAPGDAPPALQPGGAPGGAPEGVPQDGLLYDFHGAKAKREHWAAEREHAAYRKEAGALIELAEHIAAMADLGAMVRARLEGLAGQLAPQLVGRDEAGIRAVVADQVEQLLRDLAAAARKHAGAEEGGA